MPSQLSTFIKLLEKDFPAYQFREGPFFQWNPDNKLIYFQPHEAHPKWLLLHELGHAELCHKAFSFDIELVRLESQAWMYASNVLGPRYLCKFDENFIQGNLDTYRAWLHKRSTCPKCAQTGLQRSKNTYSCLNCRYSWRVNDAKQCQLRRYSLGG